MCLERGNHFLLLMTDAEGDLEEKHPRMNLLWEGQCNVNRGIFVLMPVLSF